MVELRPYSLLPMEKALTLSQMNYAGQTRLRSCDQVRWKPQDRLFMDARDGHQVLTKVSCQTAICNGHKGNEWCTQARSAQHVNKVIINLQIIQLDASFPGRYLQHALLLILLLAILRFGNYYASHEPQVNLTSFISLLDGPRLGKIGPTHTQTEPGIR